MAALALRRSAAMWLAALTAATLPIGAFASEARDWLERMNKALSERSYDGTFFHTRGGRAESMRIVHRVQEGEVCERLMSLDGSGREFVRRGNEVSYVLPDQEMVLTEERPRTGGLLPTFPRIDDRQAEFYEFSPVKKVRVMGRDARFIALTPRDPFRYGYRVWIDARSHMPLKTELHDAKGEVLERIAFANLMLMRSIPDETFRLPAGSERYRRVHSRFIRTDSSAGVRQVWTTASLPRGFRLTQQVEQTLPGTDRPVSHLVFSDGLASVSVFIGAAVTLEAAQQQVGGNQQGAATTLVTVIDGKPAVVVGEVPLRTARMIASQLKAARSASPNEPRRPAAPAAPAAPSAAAPAP